MKSIVQQNIKHKTFTARRLIKDHMSNNLKPQTILIDNPLISSVRSAYQRYRDHLQEIRNEKKKNKSNASVKLFSLTWKNSKCNATNSNVLLLP